MSITLKHATEIRFRGGGHGIKIMFPFDHGTLAKVRELSGRHYHDTPEGRFWTCPLTIESIQKLVEYDFVIDDALKEHLTVKQFAYDGKLSIPTLKGTLFPFQEEGIAFIEHHNGRAIIGDEQGLGKTMEALAYLELRKDLRPAIIVVPSSLKFMWADKAQEWMSNPKIQILSGLDPSQPIYGDIIIVNYEIMANRWDKHAKKEIPDTGWINRLLALKPKILVIDEIHNIMHSTARQTKAVLRLGRHCEFVIGLGGTMILNRPIEGYNAIKLIDPTIIPPTRFEFGIRFCAGYHNGFGFVFNGASNLSELNTILSKVMLRRLKADVLPELPAKLRSVIRLEITNREEYDDAEEDFISWVRKNRGPQAAKRASNAEAFTRVEVLKQIAAKGKLKAVIAWVEEFLSTGNKLVLFATHRNIVDSLFLKFNEIAVKLIGGMSSEETNCTVRMFQENKNIQLLIGILDSRGRPAGIGHTFTAASSTAFVEFPWSPGICDQAEDRVHRIGQVADSVNAYYLVAEDTIELRIAKLIDKKRKIVDAVLDGKETEEESLLVELLASYDKEHE